MATKRYTTPGLQCSFCGKDQNQVKRLISGPRSAFICDQCVFRCYQILTEGADQVAVSRVEPQVRLTPKAIHKKLEDYVVGQERAKKVLSVAVYNHYKRTRSSQLQGDVQLDKTNILLVGPTGSGKTLLAQTLAKILDVPFAIADATALTEAGYVGEDVENILLRLIQASDFDISRAEKGIVYIDEIDKISRKGPNPSITRDVSGEGVQQGLLKIIEGCIANVPPQGGRKHPHQEFIQIRTDGILFICGGTFEGLDEIVDQRLNKAHQSVGFRSGGRGGATSAAENPLQRLIPEDLVEYGLIPEFVGRLPVEVNLDPLTKEEMIRVLTEPKNALVKQFQALFAMEDVSLTFTEEALRTTAEEALKRNTGARGLRSIVEETLLEVMYELPSLSGIGQCIIGQDAILGKTGPLILTAAGTPVELNLARRKSA